MRFEVEMVELSLVELGDIVAKESIAGQSETTLVLSSISTQMDNLILFFKHLACSHNQIAKINESLSSTSTYTHIR